MTIRYHARDLGEARGFHRNHLLEVIEGPARLTG